MTRLRTGGEVDDARGRDGTPVIRRRSLARWVKRGLFGVLALVLLLAAIAVTVGWRDYGRRAEGARRARMQASPQWSEGHFVNPQPLWNDLWGTFRAMLHIDAHASPSDPTAVPVGASHERAAELASAPRTGLRATWLGHSTVLVEIDGQRILTDPMFGHRASPFQFVGPQRWYPPVVPLDAIGRIDAVLFSHDHYDHLDRATVIKMKDWNTVFVAPLGVGAHLAYWGIPEARIVDVDWWDRVAVGALAIVCVPARHASGRHLFDKDATLWAGYAIVGPVHRVYYSGDTGLFPGMRAIGERLGPFDLTLIEIGQYNRAWPDWHIGPEQAVRAHEMVRGKSLLPVHWGLMTLAFHGWTEPIERLSAAAELAGATVLTPRPGQSVEPDGASTQRWWPSLPARTAKEDPIVSTRID